MGFGTLQSGLQTRPTLTSQNTITAGAADATPLTLKGTTGQSIRLLDVRESGGTSVHGIGANGSSYTLGLTSDFWQWPAIESFPRAVLAYSGFGTYLGLGSGAAAADSKLTRSAANTLEFTNTAVRVNNPPFGSWPPWKQSLTMDDTYTTTGSMDGPLQLSVEYRRTAATVADPASATLATKGITSFLNYGASGTAAKGTVHTMSNGIAVINSAVTDSEPCVYFGYIRCDTNTNVPRLWFTDWTVLGPIGGTQARMLTGINMLINSYNASSPADGVSSGLAIITDQDGGGARGAAQTAATTYPVDVGIIVAGRAGAPGVKAAAGFATGIQVGGTSAAWNSDSRIGYGINIIDWQTAGLRVGHRHSGEAADSGTGVLVENIGATRMSRGIQVKGSGSFTRHIAVANTGGTDVWTVEGRVDSTSTTIRQLVNGHIEFFEVSDAAVPAANRGSLYVRDNGSGKSQLCVRFPTGAVQVLSTEP